MQKWEKYCVDALFMYDALLLLVSPFGPSLSVVIVTPPQGDKSNNIDSLNQLHVCWSTIFLAFFLVINILLFLYGGFSHYFIFTARKLGNWQFFTHGNLTALGLHVFAVFKVDADWKTVYKHQVIFLAFSVDIHWKSVFRHRVYLFLSV